MSLPDIFLLKQYLSRFLNQKYPTQIIHLTNGQNYEEGIYHYDDTILNISGMTISFTENHLTLWNYKSHLESIDNYLNQMKIEMFRNRKYLCCAQSFNVHQWRFRYIHLDANYAKLHPSQQRVLDLATEFYQGQKNNRLALFLQGKHGTGKTSTAEIVATQLGKFLFKLNIDDKNIGYLDDLFMTVAKDSIVLIDEFDNIGKSLERKMRQKLYTILNSHTSMNNHIMVIFTANRDIQEGPNDTLFQNNRITETINF